jgi:hypothetical protein
VRTVLGVIVINQSNGPGKQTSTSPAGNGAPFLTTGPGVVAQMWDGFYYPDNWTGGFTDPYADPLNAIDGAKHAARITADPLASLGSSCAVPFARQLRTLQPDSVCIASCGLSQTAVAADWIDSGGFNTSPGYQTLSGAALRRLHAMSRAFSGFSLGAFICPSGETEAFDADPTAANNLAASYNTLFNNYIAYLNKAKIPTAKQTKFLIPLLSTGYGTIQGAPQTTTVRAQQLLIAATRNDVQTFDDGYPGDFLHLDHGWQNTRGIVAANTYHAAL